MYIFIEIYFYSYYLSIITICKVFLWSRLQLQKKHKQKQKKQKYYQL